MPAGAKRLRGWRRLAVAIWPEPNDPQSYGDLEVDATAMLAFIEAARRRISVHITVLHLVGKAVAHALTANPDLNVQPRRDRVTPRGGADISFIVAFNDGADQAGVTIEDAGRKSVLEIARELSSRAELVRSGRDESPARAGRAFDRLPLWMIRAILRAGVWLAVDRHVDLSRFGVRAGGFGSAIVTSVGGFGIDHAYGLLSPFSRVPLAIMVGEVRDRVVAVDGEVAIRPMVTISATLDHRYLDGSHAARLAEAVRAYCADPSAFEPPT